MFVDFFIHRPVFATVCALLIILAGAVCIPNLPVAHVSKPGAAAVVVTSHLRWRRCADGREGGDHSAGRVDQRRRGNALHVVVEHQQRHVQINVTFQTGYNLDVAAMDVQNRVASAQGRLPGEVNATGINITEGQTTISFSARDSTRSTAAIRTNSSRTIWMFT